MFRLLFTIFLISIAFTLKSQNETYPSLPADYFDQWEDCGIDPGTIRGGQYSAEELNKICAENKARKRNKIIVYSISGIIALFIVYKLAKRGSKGIKNGVSHKKLAMNFNGVYLLLEQIKQKTHYTDITNDLLNTTIIAKIEICDFIELEKKNMSLPIIVPSISKEVISIQHALNLTIREIYTLANQADLTHEIEEIFDEGPLFHELKQELDKMNNSTD